MAELIFKEDTHEYFLDGVRLPSVSEVKSPLDTWIRFVNEDTLERARAFGSAVHLTVQLFLEGDLDESALDAPLAGCLGAFKSWRDKEGRDFFDLGTPIIETPIAHPRLRYAGTPDLRWPGLAIIDLKSRPYDKRSDPVQLAAYEGLDKENGGGCCDKHVLELRLDGTYKFKPAENNQAWGVFRKFLDYYHLQLEIDNLVANWKG